MGGPTGNSGGRLRHPEAFNTGSAVHGWLVGGIAIGCPGWEDAGTYHLIAKLSKPVSRVSFESALETVMGAGTPAFPPLDDAQAGEYRCCVGSIGAAT